jgi:hypothetical protein
VKNDPEQKEIKIKAVCLFWKNIDGEKVSAIDVYFDPTPLADRYSYSVSTSQLSLDSIFNR